jgi:hypothetical protein
VPAVVPTMVTKGPSNPVAEDSELLALRARIAELSGPPADPRSIRASAVTSPLQHWIGIEVEMSKSKTSTASAKGEEWVLGLALAPTNLPRCFTWVPAAESFLVVMSPFK